jgi:Ca-activated chloride channel family protein
MPINPVTVSVRLDPGFPVGTVESHTHEIEVKNAGPDTRLVTLKETAPADRDFELTWKPAASKAPNIGLFKEQIEGNAYVLAYITPPTVEDAAPRQNREVIFVIDNSGSMGGDSMRQAKASLDYALAHLKAGDRFNVIRFDNTMTRLFGDTRPADAENIAIARQFVGGLQAAGGTEMLPPLKAALADDHEQDRTHVRQVVFLTDGAIGNEKQLLETIGARRGRSRIFMVGIGSAPNTYLMSRAAELGRGSFTHIASTGEVDARMRALFDKLENPVVTDLRATFSTGGVDMTPDHLPDLYRGEPLVLAARMKKVTGNLTLAGKIGQRPWSVTLSLDHAAEGRGISKLWARRKIADAEVARTLGEISQQTANARVLSLALAHHLVTRLTSLVAVDETPSRPADKPLTRAEVPLNLPAGWDFEKVFGKSASDHARGDDSGAARFASIRRSSKPIVHQAASKQVVLPRTATDAELKMIVGLILLLFAGGVALAARSRRFA